MSRELSSMYRKSKYNIIIAFECAYPHICVFAKICYSNSSSPEAITVRCSAKGFYNLLCKQTQHDVDSICENSNSNHMIASRANGQFYSRLKSILNILWKEFFRINEFDIKYFHRTILNVQLRQYDCRCFAICCRFNYSSFFRIDAKRKRKDERASAPFSIWNSIFTMKENSIDTNDSYEWNIFKVQRCRNPFSIKAKCCYVHCIEERERETDKKKQLSRKWKKKKKLDYGMSSI